MNNIEVVIYTSEEHKETVIIDGHIMEPQDNIKKGDILDMLEYMGYINIKIV